MDVSGEGTLDIDELRNGYQSICKYVEGDEMYHSMQEEEYKQKIEDLCNISEERVQSLIDSTDIDGNSKMDF